MTLCRPSRRNAQTPATWLSMARFGLSLPPTVRIVVVTGEGPSFSAGLDLRMFSPEGVPGEGSFAVITDLDDDAGGEVIASYQAGFAWLRRPEIVSIAAVRGHAIGAGFQLALACDLRVAASDASFVMAEPSHGLVPDLGGTQPLVEAVGYARALELCATGRAMGAQEAERSGLVNLVVGNDALDEAVNDLVAAVLARDEDAVRQTKALLLAAPGASPEDQLRAERVAQLARLRALARHVVDG